MHRAVPFEAVGGKLHGFWYAFGEYDAYSVREAPDNVSIGGCRCHANLERGALSKFATVLLTVEETMDAMRRSGTASDRAPGTTAR